MHKIEPFLKWAGGKRWLSTEIQQKIKNLTINRYIEPFLGGGAIFFSTLPRIALLSDTNHDLILTYTQIRDNWEAVAELLQQHQKQHCKNHYYNTRESTFTNNAERAAQFIYLNRTCWNGLYRVNKNGKFNVPIGTKSNVILENDNFSAISAILKNAELATCDFETSINSAKNNDLIFADPPYTVLHNTNGFIKYNENIFSWADQIRLSKALQRAQSRGAHVIATNAAHESIQELYPTFAFNTITRPSVIGGKGAARGHYEESIITNI